MFCVFLSSAAMSAPGFPSAGTGQSHSQLPQPWSGGGWIRGAVLPHLIIIRWGFVRAAFAIRALGLNYFNSRWSEPYHSTSWTLRFYQWNLIFLEGKTFRSIFHKTFTPGFFLALALIFTISLVMLVSLILELLEVNILMLVQSRWRNYCRERRFICSIPSTGEQI